MMMTMMIMIMIAKVASKNNNTETDKTSNHRQNQYLLELGFNKNLKNPFPDSVFITCQGSNKGQPPEVFNYNKSCS